MFRLLLIICLILAIRIETPASHPLPQPLPSLDNTYTDSIRADIRKALYTIKSSRNPDQLPELTFYAYRVSKDDTFFKILARTSLNIDTLITVNNLSSPQSVKEGDTIYIPNMRGVIIEGDLQSLEKVSMQYKVPKEYIISANRVQKLNKNFIFIPCGEITSRERSLFLGIGFAAPLMHLRRTSNYGLRKDPFTGEKSFHAGVDLGCEVNTPVYAARKGTVVFTGYHGDYGNLVIIDHSCGYVSYYGHLSKILVKKGSVIHPSSVIALSGNTGRTTGPHLHFEIRKNSKPVNPVIVKR